MALSDLLGINSTAGNAELQQAIAALQAVGVPTAAQLSLPELQKYVQSGVLTPQQYQAIQMQPDVYQQMVQQTQDTSGSDAQKAALQQLGGIVQAGGSTPINQANLTNNIAQTNQAMQAARGGIEQNAQQRGISGGGLEYINKLMNEQANAQNANMGAVNAGADNARLALQALTQQGQLGGTLQGQANQSSQAQAEAAKQIAQYNSQLQSQANQYNTQAANEAQAANLAATQKIGNANVELGNERTRYNAQVPQTVYSDQMQKAQGLVGAYGNQAQLKEQQAQNQNAFTGNLIGAGATVLGGMYGGPAGAAAAKEAAGKKAAEDKIKQDNGYGQYAHGGEVAAQCYAQGGEVHDHSICMQVGGDVPGEAEMPGDNTQNDTIDAKLSPHEIVLPRSVAQAPDAPQQASNFVRDIKGTTPTVSSFAEALRILEENGLELRLGSKGV